MLTLKVQWGPLHPLTKGYIRPWLELPGKVKNFIWRVCKSCLPTAVALAKKRVQIDLRCPWCLVRNEDATHVLFDCSFARTVWENVDIQDVSSEGYAGEILGVIQQLVNTCTREKLALIVMICWNLWNRWNKWVGEKVSTSAFGVQATAMNMLDE